jgi:uncharacterized protein (TIGR03000 family)
MRAGTPTGGVLAFLSLATLLGEPSPAAAQWLSKWGHPVVTLGWTPYDSVNTGHGNYPGSPGFIPGYGYYPGQGPDHYPWLDGPGVPFDRRKLAAPRVDGAPDGPAAEEAPPPGAALVVVKLPAEAELWVDGAATRQGGSYRCFVTPPLEEGRPVLYTLRVRWRVKGAELCRVEEVQVRPGTVATVNFLTTDSWTGRLIEAPPDARIAAH